MTFPVRPSAYPDWATNVNYASGPNIGTPTKVIPSAGRMADGWRNNDVPPAQEQNYEMNLIMGFLKFLDGGGAGNRIALSDLATLQVGQVDSTRVFVAQEGWYDWYTPASPYTPDGDWVVSDPGSPNGHWVHELQERIHRKKLPAVGPTPGDVVAGFVLPTPAGKINPQYESFALVDHFTQGPGLSASVTRPFADPTTGSDELYGDVLFGPTPRVGDVVRARISAAVTCADVFRLCLLVSQDGGGTFTLVTPRISSTLPVTWGNSTGNYVQVDLSFDYVVAASPTPTQIRTSLRGQANGGISLTAKFNAYRLELLRP